MEYKKVTAEIWRIGREQGMTNKEIRKNWKSLWGTVSQQVYSYNKQLDAEALDGIKKIEEEIKGTIRSYTKTPVTEQAEINSLDNIMKVVNKAVKQAGAVSAFNSFSELYDNGAGEWIQRLVSAIYDRELAEWAQGVPQYIAKLQSEIIDKMSSSLGVKIDTSEIEFDTGILDENMGDTGSYDNSNMNVFTSDNNSLDVDKLRAYINGK